MHRSLLMIFFAAALTASCTTTTGAGPDGPGGGASGGASADQIGRCKHSCDKMKFFKCSSAAEQAACYADCDAASASQIEVFTGCAESSICDPDCRTSIQPAAPSGGGGGTGATPASCGSACEKLVACSLIPASAKSECNAECETRGYQYQIDCVNETPCSQIAVACGGGGSSSAEGGGSAGVSGGDQALEVKSCESECDSINFFECASVAEHAACRQACTSASATSRDQFTACSRSSGVDCERKAACLDAFVK